MLGENKDFLRPKDYLAEKRSVTKKFAEWYKVGECGVHFKFPELQQQIDLKFENICYTISTQVGKMCRKKTVKKKILDNVCGSVGAGEFLALMGPSGAGKTTLLNVLSGRLQEGVEGNILVNGQPRNKLFKRNTSFVLQEDLFFSELTVEDTLLTTGRLVLPREASDKEKVAKVTEIIDSFRLRKCANNKVGNAMRRGISGGEKKRLNIANELLSDKPLVLMDEPTSGLDASTALMVVTVLSDLAKSGRTVIATLHQPSSQMFEMFDKLLIVADGRIAYHGPPAALVPYFSSLNYRCPKHYNPLDYVMELVDDHPDQDDPKALKRAISDTYSPDKVLPFAKEYFHSAETKPVPPPLLPRRKYEATWFQQYAQLFKRGFKQHLPVTILNSVIFMFIAVLGTIVWWQRDYKEPAIGDRIGLLFFVLLEWFAFPMFGSMNSFILERVIFIKERQAAVYRVSAYYVAKFTSELPLDLITPLLFCTLVYWGTNLNYQFHKFVIFTLIIYVGYLVGQTYGVVLAALLERLEVASPIAMFMFFVTTLVAGFYATPDRIPDWFAWLKYTVPLKYLFDALAINEFTDSPKFKMNNGLKQTGEQILDNMDIILDNVWKNFAVLIGFLVVGQIIAFVLLYRGTKTKQARKKSLFSLFRKKKQTTENRQSQTQETQS